jgi:hypothetical protein
MEGALCGTPSAFAAIGTFAEKEVISQEIRGSHQMARESQRLSLVAPQNGKADEEEVPCSEAGLTPPIV